MMHVVVVTVGCRLRVVLKNGLFLFQVLFQISVLRSSLRREKVKR